MIPHDILNRAKKTGAGGDDDGGGRGRVSRSLTPGVEATPLSPDSSAGEKQRCHFPLKTQAAASRRGNARLDVVSRAYAQRYVQRNQASSYLAEDGPEAGLGDE